MHKFENCLVVGISSRALFDLEEENKIFEEQGVAAYAEYQIKNETNILKPGSGFALVKALLKLNNIAAGERKTKMLGKKYEMKNRMLDFITIKCHNEVKRCKWKLVVLIGEEMMNTLLEEALNNYEIQNPQIEFIRHNENETYKLKDTILNNQYCIRIHKSCPDFSLQIFGFKNHSVDLLVSEMKILNAISETTEIPVQIPVKNKSGEFVTVLSDGTPVTLLRWIDGNIVEGIGLTEDVLFKTGEMVGKFHNFSKTWSESENLNRYSYDKKLLADVISKMKIGVELNVLSVEQFKVIEDAVIVIGKRMNELDLLENSVGIVHSDLSKSNLIINNGIISPIDFCLCGYSYYYMDLGSLCSHFDKPEQQSTIIKGYKSIIDEEIDKKYIEPFFVFQIILFIATHIENAQKWDWFNDALNRWSREYFIPLSNNISFL